MSAVMHAASTASTKLGRIQNWRIGTESRRNADASLTTAAARGANVSPMTPTQTMIARMIAACAFAVAIGSPAVAGDCIRDSYGRVVCGGGQCQPDQYGKVYCAREGGGAMREQYGKVVCGIGYCAADSTGRVKCSTRPGGGALIDINGNVQCAGGCREGSAQFCDGLMATSGTAAAR